MHYAVIKDFDEAGNVLPGLRDLLKPIRRVGHELDWWVLALMARADPSSGEPIIELEDRVARNPSGLYMSWVELCSFADTLVEAEELVVVATLRGKTPVPLHERQRLYLESEIVIEAFDFTEWLIYFRDSSIAAQLSSSFRQVEFHQLPG